MESTSNNTSNQTEEEKPKVSFRGPDGGPRKYDLEKLKKLQIQIKIGKPKTENDASTSKFDPGLITPVRRPDEGKVPLFSKIQEQNDCAAVKTEVQDEKPRVAKSSDREEHRKSKRSRRTRTRSRSRSPRQRRSDRRYRDCLSGRDYLLRLQREAMRRKYERRRRERRRRHSRHRSRSRSRSSSKSSGSSSDESKSRSSHSRSRSASSGRSEGQRSSRERRRRSGSRSRERSSRQVVRLADQPENRTFHDGHSRPFRPMMPMRPMFHPPFMRPPFIPGPPMPFYPGAPMLYPVPFRPYSMPPLRGGTRGRRP